MSWYKISQRYNDDWEYIGPTKGLNRDYSMLEILKNKEKIINKLNREESKKQENHPQAKLEQKAEKEQKIKEYYLELQRLQKELRNSLIVGEERQEIIQKFEIIQKIYAQLFF